MSQRATARSPFGVCGVDGDEVSSGRPGALGYGSEMPGLTWRERAGRRGAPVCTRVCPVRATERFGRGVECELRPVQGSRVGVSGGAGTK